MSKLGRPRIDNPRDIQCWLRMNREEADLMEEASALSGMSVSDTIREVVRRMDVEERGNVRDKESDVYENNRNIS